MAEDKGHTPSKGNNTAPTHTPDYIIRDKEKKAREATSIPKPIGVVYAIEARLEAERTDLIRLRDTFQMQLNIVVNELNLIERVLNPVAEAPPDALPDAQEAPQQPPDPPNTI